ncbi:hypothetical protein ACFHW1_02035 [Micromonospora sp. LOL_014]|uniref:hypothetical protein n=1 Tax=Micromonospora sp. LOL_014 TaxID=3345415 RepID=UPI003A8B7697
MIATYGVAHLFQAVAAARTTVRRCFDPGLLLRLARQPVYLIGLGCQCLAFVLAFLARRDLPLFLVQASVAAALGVTALLGVLTLGWRLPTAEVVLLVLLLVGVTALVVAARPAPAHPLGPRAVAVIALAGLLIAACGAGAARLDGPAAAVLLGLLAGFAFSAAAVASRPLAGTASYRDLVTEPLLYLLIAHSAIGQWLIGLAMQRGSVTAAIAAMDAAGAVPAAIVGLLLLNDKIWPGREWLAAVGFLITLAAVLGLTRYATTQHAPETAQPAWAGGPGRAGRPVRVSGGPDTDSTGQPARTGVAVASAGAVASSGAVASIAARSISTSTGSTESPSGNCPVTTPLDPAGTGPPWRDPSTRW